MSTATWHGRRWGRVAAVLLPISFTLGSGWPLGVLANDEAGNAYAALTAGFREGDFGTSVTSELYSLTPEFGYVSDSYDLSASIPFHTLRVSGGGLSSSESGIGDAVVRAGRRLWRDEQAGYSLNGGLTLKLATGDEDKGLGTGATDLGVSLSGTRKVGAYAFTALAAYTQVGEPTGVTYDNVVSYGIGVNRGFTRSNVFASLQGQTSAVPGGTDPLEFDAGFFRILSPEYVVVAHAFVGLSDGSPADGMGVGIVRWFR
jgi:hypothetical protein